MFKIKIIFIGIHNYSLEFITGFLHNFLEGLISKFKGRIALPSPLINFTIGAVSGFINKADDTNEYCL